MALGLKIVTLSFLSTPLLPHVSEATARILRHAMPHYRRSILIHYNIHVDTIDLEISLGSA